MKYPFIILIIATLFLFYKAYDNALKKRNDFAVGSLKILRKSAEPLTINIQIADTISKRAQGLMGVQAMDKNSGMLFIYDDVTMRRMWMKDTFIPLDMLFIDEHGTIFNFMENAAPKSENIIYSVGPAKYVLELNAGFIKNYDIKIGDKIEFN